MRSWIPTWSLDRPDGDPRRLSYVGGEPVGFPQERWPVCTDGCGTPMSFLFQLAPGPHIPGLPADHVVFVFKCDTEEICEFWDCDAGANAALLIPFADLGDVPTAPPPSSSDYPTRVLLRLWATRWDPVDDQVGDEYAPVIDSDGYWDLPDEIASPFEFDTDMRTRTGQVPFWTGHGPTARPERPRRFLFQIDGFLKVEGDPDRLEAAADAVGGTDADDGYVEIANFMSDGTGYLFDVAPQGEPAHLKFEMSR